MARYDAAASAILGDPRIASDASDPRVAAYVSLFVADSAFPKGAMAAWAQEGEQGRAYRPGAAGRLLKSTVVSVSAGSTDTAAFEICTVRSFVIVDASGQTIGSEGGIAAAHGVAVRENGEWRLRDLTEIASSMCRSDQGGAS
jgi:hypothetical protein